MNVSALAREHGIHPLLAHQRIRRGWDVLRACTTPARAYFREWQPHRTNEGK